MDERIKQIIADLKQVADETQSNFGALSSEQLNHKPAIKSWSIGQCLEHIIKTNEMFYPEFDKIASGNRKNSLIENFSPLSGFFGRYLIKAVSEDSKKTKVPSNAVVPPSKVSEDIVDRFTIHIDEINRRVESCAGADRQKTVVTSPFLFVATYTLEDAYTVLVEHTRRHVRQAKRVMDADNFPRSSVAAQ